MARVATHGERFLVLGGAGFLGSYIVEALLYRGETSVAVFDLKEPADSDKDARVAYHSGELCDKARLLDVLKTTRATVVYHTISPIHGASDEVQRRVNVDGTKALLGACQDNSLAGSVKKLVYTSSTGVVWKEYDLRGVSEAQAVIPAQGYDAYHHTKAIAERLVLDANGSKGLHTVVLRPCGMIGPRDQQLMHRLATVLAKGQHKVQIGDGSNLVDWAYVGNVADAHLLAADKLPFSLPSDQTSPHPVAGQVFFITNGSPVPGWDFSRMVWRELGAPQRDLDPKNIVKIPRWIALLLATIAEMWCEIFGGSTEFTRFVVLYSTATQYYNIDKARVALGYKPRVTLEDAVKLSVRWWKARGAREYAEATESK